MSAGTEHPSDEWDATRRRVLNRDGHACRFCGTTDDEHRDEHDTGLHVHHVIPRNDGGSDDPENLLAVCCRCHRTLEETHAKAVGEMNGQKERLVRSLLEARKSISTARAEEWHQLLGGPLVPTFRRHAGGEGLFLAETGEFSARERAAYHAGVVEAYHRAGTKLEKALIDHGAAEEVTPQKFGRPQWSDYRTECETCGFEPNTHRDECPNCSTGISDRQTDGDET